MNGIMENKLELLSISTNYLDLTRITLPQNLAHFDHVIIVTKPSDQQTIDYLESLNNNKITIIKTDAFTYQNSIFNKGLALDVGLRYLKFKKYVCIADIDIIFPNNFRQVFFSEDRNKETMWGMRRRDIQTKLDYDKLLTGEKKITDFRLFRGISYGFMTLFHYESSIFQRINKQTKGFPYPAWFNHGAESDHIFRNLWSDWIFSPSLNDAPNQHEIPNNDYAVNPDLLKELPMELWHLGLTGFNSKERITPEFK
jgi:hypothetical protein